jgi:hypothetical protein
MTTIKNIKSVKNTSEERAEFINRIGDKSEPTVKQYLSQYDKIYTLVKKDLIDCSKDEIISAIEDVNNVRTLNAKKNVYNVLVMFFNNIDKDRYETFVEKRENLRSEIAEEVKVKNVEKNDTLPSYDKLKEHLNQSEGSCYIINYLLMNYYVRNMDLDLTITRDQNMVNSKDGNWLIVSKTDITYHRNKFKTVKSKGPITIVVKNRIFRKHVVDYLGKQGEVDLITGGKLDHFIRKCTYNNLGETDYLKTLVKHYMVTSNVVALNDIPKYRGSSIDLVMKNYNPLYKKEKELMIISDEE